MPIDGAHFHAGDDVEWIPITLFCCPQTAIQPIVVGDGDHVEAGMTRHVIENLLRRCQPIAQMGVHVNIRRSVVGIVHGATRFLIIELSSTIRTLHSGRTNPAIRRHQRQDKS